MSLLSDAERVEESLYNQFQDELEKYYDWEEESKAKFLSSFLPEEE